IGLSPLPNVRSCPDANAMSLPPDTPMSPRPRLRRGVAGRGEITAWALYDFASNAFNTLVITFIFSRYFQSVVAPDEVTGGVLWTRAVNLSAILVALVMPVMGAIAYFS